MPSKISQLLLTLIPELHGLTSASFLLSITASTFAIKEDNMRTTLSMTTVTLFATLAFGTTAMSNTAYARPGDVNENPAVKKFQSLDIDNDGTLTVTEAGKDKLFNTSAFAKADIDKDGTLDQKEYTDYRSAAENREAKRVLNDSVITSKVKADIVKEEGFKGLEISVETHKGVVQLSGFVESKEQISRAEEIAKEIDGVKSVKNSLIVKS